jgi:hypothetical protein
MKIQLGTVRDNRKRIDDMTPGEYFHCGGVYWLRTKSGIMELNGKDAFQHVTSYDTVSTFQIIDCLSFV